MKVSNATVDSLVSLILGDDGGLTPYRRGIDIHEFFEDITSFNVPVVESTSRATLARQVLRKLNGTVLMLEAIERVFEAANYVRTDYSLEKVAVYLNETLQFDGYKVQLVGKRYKCVELTQTTVNLQVPFAGGELPNQLFITEQIDKCNRKLAEGDYDGAITNARSLVEAVLRHIEHEFMGEYPSYDGDIGKLYKRVQKLLNLEPSRKDIAEPLKQILSGLNSIVLGLGGIRNKLSDAHAANYRPAEHHARLAVNSAQTLAQFIFDTHSYQVEKKLV